MTGRRSMAAGCCSDDVGKVTADLLAMSYEERMMNACIGRERADLVMAGCAILEEIRLAFPANRIRVADRGLREGILTQLMMEDGTYGRDVMSRPGSRNELSGRNLKVKVKTGKGRTVSQKIWLERQLNDPYVIEAKKLGYRSRSAFKLIEIDDKYKFLEAGPCGGGSGRGAGRLVPGGIQAGEGGRGAGQDHCHRHAWHGSHSGGHHFQEEFSRR